MLLSEPLNLVFKELSANKKNVTPLVIFNLMLKMMQKDELWIK